MSLALKSYRLKNQLSSLIAPSWTAKKAMSVFITPRRLQPKEWELKAESLGHRFNINERVSAVQWKTERTNSENKLVLLAHGWESRATQMYGFVPQLLQQGYHVVALDMPAHGHSKGNTADPLKFAETIMLAEEKLGKFEAIIGHSMGASAIGIAVNRGLRSNKVVLISGPSSIENVLRSFSKFVGLSSKSTDWFVYHVGEYAKVSASKMDSDLLQTKSNIPALIIHDKKDFEIPFSESKGALLLFNHSKLLATDGLGHRKILKSELVLNKIDLFLREPNSSLD